MKQSGGDSESQNCRSQQSPVSPEKTKRSVLEMEPGKLPKNPGQEGEASFALDISLFLRHQDTSRRPAVLPCRVYDCLEYHDVSFVFSMKIQPVRFRKSNSASRQPSIPPQPPGTGTAMCLLAIVQASRRLHRETNLRDTSLNRCLRVNAPSLNELIQNYQLKLPA